MRESIIRIEGEYNSKDSTFKGTKEIIKCSSWLSGQKNYIDNLCLEKGIFFKYFENEQELKEWSKSQVYSVELIRK